MRSLLRLCWTLLCILIASGMLAALLGLKFDSTPLGITGAVLGIPAGWLFAKLVSPWDLLDMAD